MFRTFCLVTLFCCVFSTKAQVSFVNQASQLGIDITCGTTYLGNGVTFYDFDNDGWDDITLTTEFNEEIRFFKNTNGSFTEIFPVMPYFDYQTKQVNWVDFDNDGDNDLFVTSDFEGNRLFENNGSFEFQDITLAAGIDNSNMYSYGSSWGDYDNDGYLDIFISNRTPAINNKLYKNNGDGTFTDVSIQAGISPSGHGSFCAAFLDINNDGYQDIYISNDRPLNPNILYKNNGDGTFTDISVSSGTDVTIDAMTVTVGDYNNDGWFDIYITNGPIGNVLLRNNGDETFTDVAVASGTVFNSISWGASFFDADNDMDQDLYVCGEFDSNENNFLRAAFYLNNDDGTFTLNNASFPGDDRAAYSSATGDLDNDGYPELIVTNSFDQNLFFWKNNTPTTNNWIKLKLEGTQSNRDGVGSRIELSVNGEKQYAYTHCGEGYLSQNSAVKIIGVGSNTEIDYIKITWLSGVVDYLSNVSVNQQLNIVEGTYPELSIPDLETAQIQLYPNPVERDLFINTTLNDFEIEIYDILGKIQNVKVDSKLNKIDLSTLNPGMYFVKIESANGVIIKRILKK